MYDSMEQRMIIYALKWPDMGVPGGGSTKYYKCNLNENGKKIQECI